MKKLLLLLSLFVATPAFACDRIAGQYAVAKMVDFCLFITDATVGAIKVENAVHASGDTYVMKDEGAEANTANGFTDEGSCYSIALSSTEMTAARVTLNIEDQGTKAWADKCIVIETYGDPAAEHSDSALVEAIWNQPTSSHTTAGTTGKALADSATGGNTGVSFDP